MACSPVQKVGGTAAFSAPLVSTPMDASDNGVVAVVSQLQSGVEKVIVYASRTMLVAERKYETTRKELLAVVYGLKQFR